MALRGEVGSEGPGLGEVPRVREREVARTGHHPGFWWAQTERWGPHALQGHQSPELPIVQVSQGRHN